MPLPIFTRKLVEARLEEYCEHKVPSHVRDKVRLSFKFRGNTVTLIEKRPAFMNPSEWVDIVVAQFRFDPKSKKWTLYCADRNSRWHEYWDQDPSRDFERLLREVDEDPTGIFWG